MGMTGELAFAMGTALPVDRETMTFGVVIAGGTMTGVEVSFKTGAVGMLKGCGFGADTGAIRAFAALLVLGQL